MTGKPNDPRPDFRNEYPLQSELFDRLVTLEERQTICGEIRRRCAAAVSIALEALAANVAAIIADAPSRWGATAFFQKALQISLRARTQSDCEGT